ncbi:MAG: hypothetical protein WCF90_09335, partial [Methanomicrobiales archaeon]
IFRSKIALGSVVMIDTFPLSARERLAVSFFRLLQQVQLSYTNAGIGRVNKYLFPGLGIFKRKGSNIG